MYADRVQGSRKNRVPGGVKNECWWAPGNSENRNKGSGIQQEEGTGGVENVS
jgi:hypothetical protein